ncbi:MAG: glycosyltransferase [Saprospiraceae bacterium]
MRVLICPLDWGLGHASRCIPIIERYLAEGATVVIASNGGAAQLLKKQFPALRLYSLPSYGIHYPTRSALFNFFLSAPRICYAVIVEHFRLRKIINREQIEYVISDNRLGCWSKAIPSFYISHQLQFAFRQKWLNSLAAWAHYCWYKNYKELWIPDLPPPQQIAGKLAQPFGKKTVRYLGLLSQLESKEATLKYQALVILSGPEPQRSLLETKILTQLEQLPGPFLVVRGLPDTSEIYRPKNQSIASINFLGAKELSLKIAEASVVICRSGYSSIMDLLHLHQKAILIPTPGQPEQEYLAKYHAQNPLFKVATQDNFKLEILLKEMADQPSYIYESLPPNDLLGEVIIDAMV